MKYKRHQINKVVVVEFEGDFSAGPDAEQLLSDLSSDLRGGAQKVVFDIGTIDYINSSGIRVLLRAKQIIEGQSGVFGLVNIQKAVHRILQDIHIISFFQCYTTVDEACAVS